MSNILSYDLQINQTFDSKEFPCLTT